MHSLETIYKNIISNTRCGYETPRPGWRHLGSQGHRPGQQSWCQHTTYTTKYVYKTDSQTVKQRDERTDQITTWPQSFDREEKVGAHNNKILTKASTHLSSFIVPQQPQNARRAMVPPPAMIRYVAISNIRDPTRTEISRALYSVTSSHIPMPSTPKPMIWNTKVFLIKKNLFSNLLSGCVLLYASVCCISVANVIWINIV